MNPSDPLDKVRVVLSHPSHPGNIGAVARAMKTMGLDSLYLVNPKTFPDKEAERRAAGAWDILNNAKVCSNLDEALSGTVLAAAITARPRDLLAEVFDARRGALELHRSYAARSRWQSFLARKCPASPHPKSASAKSLCISLPIRTTPPLISPAPCR